VGYTLSGGIDSSSILCAAREIWGGDFTGTAFSLVFPGQIEDESQYIMDVVRHLSIPSEAVTATPEDFYRELSDFVRTQEEPFGSLSYYGEYRLRSLIRQVGVRVTVEGQGADEIVGGYKSLIPSFFESLALDGRMHQLKRETELFDSMVHISWKGALMGAVRKWWGGTQPPDYGRYAMILPDKLDVKSEDRAPWPATLGLEDHMERMLTRTSIPEQLVRSDKSSMAFSSEARFPFLDHRLVEFSRSLPYSYKIGDGIMKRILRMSVRDILPATIYERRDKVGFAVPFKGWRDGEVGRRCLEQIMDSPAPFLDKDVFREAYAEGGGSDWTYWKVASLTMWMNEFIA
jgi:asparagine synthase (glutamine-hydrolysing)